MLKLLTIIIPADLESLFKSTIRKMEWFMGKFRKENINYG
jgi:hypothetical protein